MSNEESHTVARIVCVGVPSPEEAAAMGRILVEERLVGAANVISGVKSIFWWRGAVQEIVEATLVLFTLADNVEAVTARIQQLHSYVTPGIKAWTVSHGSADWLAWLNAEADPCRLSNEVAGQA